jgi:MFS family permease
LFSLKKSKKPIFYGWWIVAVCSAMVFMASGIFFRGFTVLVPAMRDSLGLSQMQTNLVFSIARSEGGLEGLFAGWFIDKLGNKKILIPMVILAGTGYILFSIYVHNFLTFALIYLLVISLGNSAAFQHALFAGVNQWFRRRRSLAISTLAAISSLGGLVMVPVLNLIIARKGWRTATLISGLIYFIVILPLTFFFKNKPEDMGLHPDGDELAFQLTTSEGEAKEIRDYTVHEALSTKAYWFLLFGTGLRMLATMGVLVTIIPILETKGLSRQTAANFTGFMFGLNFLSRMVFGYLGDIWPKQIILTLTLMLECSALVCLFYASPGSYGLLLIWAFILFEGLGDGAGIIVWATLGDFFGRDKFASLRGIITFSHSWALIASPIFAGWVFDKFGNYQIALLVSAVCAGMSAGCFIFVRRPPVLVE